jgi:hypothetical protein
MGLRIFNDPPAHVSLPVAQDALSVSLTLLAAVHKLYSSADALTTVRAIAAQLATVSLATLDNASAQKAFWLNVYNALSHHALHELQAEGTMLTKLGFYASTAYCISKEQYSLNTIEHGILRQNRRPPLSLFRTLSDADPRAKNQLQALDPRVHFALHCGARSCPAIRRYEADTIDAQLRLATEAYLAQETLIDQVRNRVTLPYLCRLYSDDFGDRSALLAFVLAHLEPSKRAWIEQNSQKISYKFGTYDWTVDRTDAVFAS